MTRSGFGFSRWRHRRNGFWKRSERSTIREGRKSRAISKWPVGGNNMSAIEANGATSKISMSRTLAAKSVAEKTPFYRKLYVQVLIAVALGATLGYLYPEFSTSLKPYGDAFVRAIKIVVAPIIFTTIVVGIAKMGHIRRVATVAVKALIYFDLASTLALIIGMIVGNLWKVGVGLNADPAAFDT